MIVSGVHVSLRPVEVRDAAFILRLRLSPRGIYLSPTEDDLPKQEAWIKAYKAREAAHAEYYFIIHHATAGDVGTARIYDIQPTSFCWGSWILDETAPRESALESSFLIYEYAFFRLNLDRARFSVRKHNVKAAQFQQRFGARLTDEDEQDLSFEVRRDDYLLIRSRIENEIAAETVGGPK